MDGGDTGEGAHVFRAWKAPVIWDAYQAMGYDVVGLGARDISDTSIVWLDQHQGKKPTFLAGNMKAKKGTLGKKYTIIEKGGLRIGIVHAIQPKMVSRLPGIVVTPEKEVLDEASAAFDQAQVDFKIAILQTMLTEARKIAQERKDYDLILVGRSRGRAMNSEILPNLIPLVGPGDRGRELAWVHLTKSGTAPAKVTCTVIPLDDKVAPSAKAEPFMQKAKDTARSIFYRMQQENNQPKK